MKATSSTASFWESLPSQRRRKKRKVKPILTSNDDEVIFVPESVPLPSIPHESFLNDESDVHSDLNSSIEQPLPYSTVKSNSLSHDCVDGPNELESIPSNDEKMKKEPKITKEEQMVRDLLPILRPYMQCEECERCRDELESVKNELEEWKRKYQQLKVTSIVQQASRSIQKQKREKEQTEKNSTALKSNANNSHYHPTKTSSSKHISMSLKDGNPLSIVPENVISSSFNVRSNDMMTPSKIPEMSQELLGEASRENIESPDITRLKSNQNYSCEIQNDDHEKRSMRYERSKMPSVRIKQENICLSNYEYPKKNDQSNQSLLRIKEEKETTPTKQITEHKPPSQLGKENKRQFKYCEVVRNQKVRQTELQGYTCEECKAFFDATGMDSKELHVKDCSRHRYRFTPPSTPEGFWELSFVDERNQNKRTSWP